MTQNGETDERMFSCLSPGTIGIRASLPETIALAQRHGFQGVDFSVGEAAQLAHARGIDHVRGLFTQAEVRPASFGLPVRWNGDEDQWRSGVEALPAEQAAAEAGDSLHRAFQAANVHPT